MSGELESKAAEIYSMKTPEYRLANAATSIAISLKRLADVVEKIYGQK